jgi:hypothetical protein
MQQQQDFGPKEVVVAWAAGAAAAAAAGAAAARAAPAACGLLLRWCP